MVRRLAEYYARPEVQARIAEYCGGRAQAPGSFSALSLAGFGGSRRLREQDCAPVECPKQAFAALLAQCSDVCRSLADHEATLMHLDVDYVDTAAPWEPYLNSEAVFERLEPVLEALLAGFARYGLRPLVLLTGRGYHLAMRVPAGSRFHAALVAAGPLESSLQARYQALEAGIPGALEMGRAHEGAGRLLEHLAQGVVRRLRGASAVPVELADLPVVSGGPYICLDLSAYADPLFARHVRCAFASNQRAWMTGACPEQPFVIALPRAGRPLAELLAARTDLGRVAEIASAESAWLPVADVGGLAWIEDYQAGSLARFHRDFDQGPRVARELWRHTYDEIQPESLPACASLALWQPDPALLQPAYLRTVALALWGLGWHPRSVAELVRSRYERSSELSPLWRRYDPAARASFYVRLFCAAAAAGADPGFDCRSQRERGVCNSPACHFELARLAGAAVARREARTGPGGET